VRKHRDALQTEPHRTPGFRSCCTLGAFFKRRRVGRTDVYFRSAPDTGAVALVGHDREETGRTHGPGLLALTVPPGQYDYGIDADSSGVVGPLAGPLDRTGVLERWT